MEAQAVTDVATTTPHGWAEAFPGEEYEHDDRRAQLIDDLVKFLTTSNGREIIEGTRLIGTTCVLEVDLDQLLACPSDDLKAALDLQPAECLSCIVVGCTEAIFRDKHGQLPSCIKRELAAGTLKVRLLNHSSACVLIKDLKANCIGRLLTVRGTVVRACGVRPYITGMDFSCASCGATLHCQFASGKYTPPTRCSESGCRGRTFIPVKGSSTSMDWQKIRLQEIASTDIGGAGRIPRTVDVELLDDLVDTCSAGDVVTVVGFVKVINTEQDQGWTKTKKSKSLFLIYIQANSVVNSARARPGVDESSALQRAIQPTTETATFMPPFSMKDLQFIYKFTEACEGFQFRELVHALCPTIHGHEMVKAAIILALMGGVRKHAGDKYKVPVRGDIHVLICGDPGLGKSQLLQAAAAVAPRGLYLCGNASTTAGLTVSVVQDALTGEFGFEAGALVLADCGICCVDELDKLKADQKALLGAMEQQEVTIAKAGLCATLPARTSVLAAANPVEGHYNRGRTLMENLKMSDAMLSRFDLVFLLLDKPDELQDQLLSDHILAMHSGQVDRSRETRKRLLQQQPGLQHSLGSQSNGGGMSLELQLKMHSAEDSEPMWPSLMRTYIHYARQHCFPRLSDEAKQVLREFYFELRQKAQSQSGLPITTRQLESLVRLSEARARCDLREVVTRQHALEVVELMKSCVWDEWAPLCDVAKGAGRRGGRKAEATRLVAALQRRAEQQEGGLLAAADIFSIADEIDLQVENVRVLIEELNEGGVLEKKGNGMFRVAAQ